MLAAQDFTHLGSRAFVCSVVYRYIVITTSAKI